MHSFNQNKHQQSAHIVCQVSKKLVGFINVTVFVRYFGIYSSLQCRRKVMKRCCSCLYRRLYKYSPNIKSRPPSCREFVAGRLHFICHQVHSMFWVCAPVTGSKNVQYTNTKILLLTTIAYGVCVPVTITCNIVVLISSGLLITAIVTHALFSSYMWNNICSIATFHSRICINAI